MKETEENKQKDNDEASPKETDTETPTFYPRERHKSLLVASILLMAAILNPIIAAVNHDIVARSALPDLVYAWVPEQQWGWQAADIVVIVCMLLMSVVVIVHEHRWIVGKRAFFVASVVFYLRALTLCLTQLPPGFSDSPEHCKPPKNRTTIAIVAWRLLILMKEMGGLQKIDGSDAEDRAYCGDLFFSGHTAFLATAAFTVNQYTMRSLWPIRWCVAILCGLGMIFMTISRAHYSIDIVIAFILTSGLFTLYHAFCDVPHRNRRKSPFRRLILFWFMFWLEENIPAGRLPNRLAWPFSRPKFMVVFMRKWNDRHLAIARTLSRLRLRTDI